MTTTSHPKPGSGMPVPSPPPARCFHCRTLKRDCDAARAGSVHPDPNVGRCCALCQHRSPLPRLPGVTGSERRGRRGRALADQLLAQPNLHPAHLAREDNR